MTITNVKQYYSDYSEYSFIVIMDRNYELIILTMDNPIDKYHG